MANFPKLDKMVFKGGTSLKKVHFENFRFSEDIDFVCFEDVSAEFMDYVKENMGGFDAELIEINNVKRLRNTFQFKIKFREAPNSVARIKVDMSLRGNVMMDHPMGEVKHLYDSIKGPFFLPTMDAEETMAEKVNAAIYTDYARHVHDIWYMNRHGIRINADMVRTKMKQVEDAEFDLDKLREAMSRKEERWELQLRPYLPYSTPPFDKVADEVIRVVADAMA